MLIFLLPLTLFARDFLVTAPRSGTHFMLYTLEYLTQRTWLVAGNNTWKWFDLGGDLEKEHLYHTHNFSRGKREREEGDRMVLIVRNYREAVSRHLGSYEKALKSIENNYDYFANLYTYEEWPEKKRLLIYYEDLMLQPQLELKKILDFLDEDDCRLEAYMKDFDYHRDRLLRYYRRMGGAKSEGNDFNYHSNKLSLEEIEAFDLSVQEHHPDLWKKYLNHYEYHSSSRLPGLS